MNKDKAKAFFELILKDFKAMETELIVRGKIIEGLERQFRISDIKDVYKLMQENPSILQTMNEKYDDLRSTYHKQIDSMISVDEFLEAWKPTGPIN
jgi:hypothetical protein